MSVTACLSGIFGQMAASIGGPRGVVVVVNVVNVVNVFCLLVVVVVIIVDLIIVMIIKMGIPKSHYTTTITARTTYCSKIDKLLIVTTTTGCPALCSVLFLLTAAYLAVSWDKDATHSPRLLLLIRSKSAFLISLKSTGELSYLY